MGFNHEEIPALRKSLFNQYGTTLRGLQAVYGVDSRRYMDFVHDLPLEEYLDPDPDLRTLLRSYPQRKIIFTNADTGHATRVLKQIGISDCFEEIIDIFAIEPYCKPNVEAFKIALTRAGAEDPGECAFIDDNLPNLSTAKMMGFFSVRVGSNEKSPDYHGSIISLRNLPDLISLAGEA
jgi:pyrimidine 5'-nucleotidase